MVLGRGTMIAEGIILIVLGVLAVLLPQVSTLAVEVFVGVLLVLSGLVQGYLTLRWWGRPGFLWNLVTGLAAIVAGVLLLAYPRLGTLALTAIITAFFFVEGIAKLVISFRLRPDPNWIWYLLSGLLSILLAALVWAGWPQSSAWLIGLLVGINLIFYGFVLITYARRLP